MKGDLTQALAIAQELLDITGASLTTGNYSGFPDCFALPSVFDTFDGQTTLNTEAELRELFDDVTTHYASLNMTELVRHIVAADWFDERTIHSTHQARILSGEKLMQAPYIVFSVLKNTGSRWQITFSQYAITDSTSHNTALLRATSTKGVLHD